MPDLARAALWYAKHGWCVFPCGPKSKEPAIKAWQKRATADVVTVEHWWRSRPDCNIGLATGHLSAVYVVDVDRHGDTDGEASLRRVLRRLGPLPETVEARTGSGGRHLFFAYPEGHECRNSGGKLGPGIDTKGDGGCIVLPPSIHPCGEAYRWTRGPHQAFPAELPDEWVYKLERRERVTIEVPLYEPCRDAEDLAARITEQRIDMVARASPGTRNAELYRTAFYLARLGRDGVIDWERARRGLIWAGSRTGLAAEEVLRTITSAENGAGTAT
jgi:hypothetical protein